MKITYIFLEDSENGEFIEEVTDENPIDIGLFPSYFIKKLKDKEVGEEFSFLMKSNEGFGEIDEEKIQYMPLEDFLVDGKVPEEFTIGNFIEIIDEHDDSKLCIILEISGNLVKMDFNHPLAGINVYAKGKIIQS